MHNKNQFPSTMEVNVSQRNHYYPGLIMSNLRPLWRYYFLSKIPELLWTLAKMIPNNSATFTPIGSDRVVCCDKLPWNDSVFIHPTGATYSSAHQPTNNTVTQHLRLLNNGSTSTATDHCLLTNSVVRIVETLSITQNCFMAYESESREILNA